MGGYLFGSGRKRLQIRNRRCQARPLKPAAFHPTLGTKVQSRRTRLEGDGRWVGQYRCPNIGRLHSANSALKKTVRHHPRCRHPSPCPRHHVPPCLDFTPIEVDGAQIRFCPLLANLACRRCRLLGFPSEMQTFLGSRCAAHGGNLLVCFASSQTERRQNDQRHRKIL